MYSFELWMLCLLTWSRNKSPVYPTYPVTFESFAAGGAPVEEVASFGFGGSSPAPLAPTIRKDFPETWIWDSVILEDRFVYFDFKMFYVMKFPHWRHFFRSWTL